MRPRPRLGRRRGRALLVAAVLGGLCACGGLPTSGPVVSGRQVGAGVLQPIRIEPIGPIPGADAGSVATGFVQAGAGFQDNTDGPDVARDFLTPRAAAGWKPTSSVTVIEAPVSVGSADGSHVQVRAKAVARIDSAGHYTEVRPGTLVTAVFAIERLAGEWRLDLPEGGFGLWLTSQDLQRLFEPVRIYYVTLSGRELVPETRWFPSGARLATTLARAQAEPVPAYLRGALTTGFPEATSLQVDAVPVVGGRANVTLTTAALQADPEQRRMMYAQMVTALSQVLTVQEVGLLAGDTKLELSGLGDSARSFAELGYRIVGPASPRTGLLRQGSTLSSVNLQQLAGLEQDTRPRAVTAPAATWPAIAPGWTSLALSVDGTELAGVGGDLKELRRWRGTAEIPMGPFASSLTRPSYDAHGFLWTSGVSGGTTRAYVIDTAARGGAAPAAVKAAWLAPRRVAALRVSPDGTRAAVVSRAPGASTDSLDIAGVIRTLAGQPVGLSAPGPEGQPLSEVRDVTWLDIDTLGVLGRVSTIEPWRPYVVDLGQGIGLRSPGSALLSPVPDGQAITSAGGPRGVLVRTERGRVKVRAGSSWVQLSAGSEVVVPGA
ncbi:MAG TPA: LpqB family beta-propeller domain-containing protein [Candidatus Lustribacter sp.]|nr:LpqB family beta-propeller domain-containing protein [Candidatus Lustribacter sp.]